MGVCARARARFVCVIVLFRLLSVHTVLFNAKTNSNRFFNECITRHLFDNISFGFVVYV